MIENKILIGHFVLNWLLSVTLGSVICALSFNNDFYGLLLIFIVTSFINSLPGMAILYFFIYLQRKKTLRKIKIDFRVAHILIFLLTMVYLFMFLRAGINEPRFVFPYFVVGTIVWEIRFKRSFKSISQTQNSKSEIQ